MNESIIISEGSYKTEFRLYWSKTYASLMIHIEESGEITEQVLVDASSAMLRELANQLYDWSAMLEQNEHDAMDAAMAEVKARRDENGNVGVVTVSPETKQRLMDEYGLTDNDFHDPYKNAPQHRPMPHPGAPKEGE